MSIPQNDASASNSLRNALNGEASPEVSLDEGWIGALSRLGRLVMVLHRLAAQSSVADFRPLAFEALHAELPFHTGIWASGDMRPAPNLHSVYGHRQPPEQARAWLDSAPHDPLLAETLRQPGLTLRATGNQDAAHTLATTYVETSPGRIESFRICRTDPKARFSEPERLLVQHALPHMLEAWRRLRRRLPLEYLTPRETDIARRFGLGANYRQIAGDLHISPATVRNHLANIYAKVGVSNKVELARLFD